MTTHNRQHTTRNTRAALLVASVITGALLLTGCTPDKPAPSHTATATKTATPTPTPTSVAAPKSEDEAVTAASKTVQEFIDISNKVSLEGGKDPDRMSAVAIDPALAGQIQSANAIAQNGYVITGGNALTVLSGYAGDLTQGADTIKFGSVNLEGCFDSSGRTVKTKDGQTAPQPPNPKTKREINVIYSPSDDRWMVRTFIKSDTTC